MDLGGEHSITSIVVFNRTDDGLGKRLDGFTLQVIAADHKTVVYHKENIPAPADKAAFAEAARRFDK